MYAFINLMYAFWTEQWCLRLHARRQFVDTRIEAFYRHIYVEIRKAPLLMPYNLRFVEVGSFDWRLQ
jgi:hypothetical protein